MNCERCLELLERAISAYVSRDWDDEARAHLAEHRAECDCERDPTDGGHTPDCARYKALHGNPVGMNDLERQVQS